MIQLQTGFALISSLTSYTHSQNLEINARCLEYEREKLDIKWDRMLVNKNNSLGMKQD